MITMLNRGFGALLLVMLAWDGGMAQAQAPAVEGSEAETMTAQQMLVASSTSIERMRGMVGQMQDLLKKAEDRGEADAIQCVRDKLANSRSMKDVSMLARNTLQEALAADQPQRAAAEFRKISVAEGMVDQFLVEAMACLSDRTDSGGEVVRNASGGTGGDDGLGDLASVVDVPGDSPDGTPYQ